MPDASDMQYELVRGQIYRWAYRLLHNHHDALDATQTVLTKMLQMPDLAAQKRSAWLRKVTVNHCIDQIRRRRESTGNLNECSAGISGAAEVELSEQRSRIAAALQYLTEPQRIVLLAKTCEQQTFEEIARSMELSSSTVKTHYVRALQKMRDRLNDMRE